MGKKYEPTQSIRDQGAAFIESVADSIGATRFRWDHLGPHKPVSSSMRPSEREVGDMIKYSRMR